MRRTLLFCSILLGCDVPPSLRVEVDTELAADRLDATISGDRSSERFSAEVSKARRPYAFLIESTRPLAEPIEVELALLADDQLLGAVVAAVPFEAGGCTRLRVTASEAPTRVQAEACDAQPSAPPLARRVFRDPTRLDVPALRAVVPPRRSHRPNAPPRRPVERPSDEPDAGAASFDAGVPDDAAVPNPIDGGTPQDAGLPQDAEPSPADGGADEDAGEPSDAGAGSTFPYAPSNFEPAGLDFTAVLAIGGTCHFDSTSNSFSGACGTSTPAVTLQAQLGGPDSSVLSMSALVVPSGGRLTFGGARPVIMAVLGDAEILGEVSASAQGATGGPGAGVGCGAAAGGDGLFNSHAWAGAGGGGGGFGTPGAPGASGTMGQTGGAGGGVRGTPDLIPLVAGCPGGTAPVEPPLVSSPGGGGGALQISVSGALLVEGAVTADGGGGGPGQNTVLQRTGGAGGGSGGAILLEGQTVTFGAAATVHAHGGGGGGGAGNQGNGTPGGVPGGGAGATPLGGDGGDGAASTAAFPGVAAGGGGGGGGGGAGRVRIRPVLGG